MIKFGFSVKNVVKMIHNKPYVDHYWYFKNDPKTLKPIIQEEKQYTKEFFEHPQINEFYLQYYEISQGRKDLRHGDLPELIDDIEYQTRYGQFNSGNDYSVIIRQKPNEEPQVILDLMQIPFLNKYHKTLKMTKMKISDDHKIIGFGLDLLNNEQQIWMFKYTNDNEILKIKLYECFDAKFTKDTKYIIYTEYDEKFRPFRLMAHKIGTTQDDDKVIFEEQDEQFYLDLQESKNKEYFILISQSKACNEIRVIRRDNIYDIQTLFSRDDQHSYYVHHHETGFYVLTNKDAQDFKVQKQVDNKFVDFYIPKDGEVIQEIDLFQGQLVLYMRKESDDYLILIDLNTNERFQLTIPSKLIYTDHKKNQKNILRRLFNKYILRDKSDKFRNIQVSNEIVAASIQPGANENYKTDSFTFHLSTPLVYNQVYKYNFMRKQLIKVQDGELTGKPFNRDEFTCTKIYAPSKDGVMIPISLVHKKKLIKNRQNKLLLHSYGAYGIGQEVPFNILYLNALERDWILAFSHIRGGNELGQNWHKSAILENKIISVDDLLSSAAALVSQGYTHPSLLCGIGGSAGATILAAAINMRPELWKCAVFQSPFLDVLGSLMDESLPLTKSDYLEFGNPNNLKDFESMLGYSPYDNIKNQVYPPIYISAGQSDFRTPLWNVVKYVRRFRDQAKRSEKVNTIVKNNLILDIQDGGHYGSAGVQASIDEKARYMAFLEYYVGPGNKDISIEYPTDELDQTVQLEDKK